MLVTLTSKAAELRLLCPAGLTFASCRLLRHKPTAALSDGFNGPSCNLGFLGLDPKAILLRNSAARCWPNYGTEMMSFQSGREDFSFLEYLHPKFTFPNLLCTGRNSALSKQQL